MKKILLLAAAVATVAASAQVDEYRMKVALADGTSANYKVADISRIDFFTVEPLSLVFDDERNKGYNTTVSNADGVYKLDFTTGALENVVWTKGFDALQSSDWVLKLTYRCTLPVADLSFMLFDGGYSMYNPIVAGVNSGAEANVWKTVKVDLSSAIEANRWNLDGKFGERMRINFNGITQQVCTLELKDVQLVPKSQVEEEPVALPDVPVTFPETGSNTAYDVTVTTADGVFTMAFPAQWNDNGTMKDVPECVVWSSGIEALAGTDYQLQYTYRCTIPIEETKIMLFKAEGMEWYAIAGDPFVRSSESTAAAANEWKTVTINLKSVIETHGWNINGKTGERIRIGFDGTVGKGAFTLELKDVKLVQNK